MDAQQKAELIQSIEDMTTEYLAGKEFIRGKTMYFLENYVSQIGPDGAAALPAFIKAIREGDTDYRNCAARGLGHLQSAAKAEVPAIVAALEKERDDVTKHNLRWALDQIDPAWSQSSGGNLRQQADVHYQKALRSMEPGGLKADALRHLKAAIETDPTYADPYEALGDVYTSMGRLDEAVEALTKWGELKSRGG